MKKAAEGTNWFFVDESGDSTFYDRFGNYIVGQIGCSRMLILGFIETSDPKPIRRAILDLHQTIAADPYLRGVPSVGKTNIAFHAKDDIPEARQAVYKTIVQLDFKAQFVVARKIEKVFQNNFRGKESKFYDHLVSELFKNCLHRHAANVIYFARRGSRTRQAPLQAAIEQAKTEFEQRWKTTVQTTTQIYTQVPSDEPALQVIDYMNWAVYRAFVNREMRYFNFVRDKVSLVLDLYDGDKYPKNYYSRDNPFDIEKASPL